MWPGPSPFSSRQPADARCPPLTLTHTSLEAEPLRACQTRDVHVSDEQFDDAVSEALDQIPPELAEMMDNVVVLVEPEPPADDPQLLGVYHGTPLTERDSWWAAGALPDRVTIFRGPLERMCDSTEELREEIAVTVIHEVAHHFGIDDERLHELGWD